MKTKDSAPSNVTKVFAKIKKSFNSDVLIPLRYKSFDNKRLHHHKTTIEVIHPTKRLDALNLHPTSEKHEINL